MAYLIYAHVIWSTSAGYGLLINDRLIVRGVNASAQDRLPADAGGDFHIDRRKLGARRRRLDAKPCIFRRLQQPRHDARPVLQDAGATRLQLRVAALARGHHRIGAHPPARVSGVAGDGHQLIAVSSAYSIKVKKIENVGQIGPAAAVLQPGKFGLRGPSHPVDDLLAGEPGNLTKLAQLCSQALTPHGRAGTSGHVSTS